MDTEEKPLAHNDHYSTYSAVADVVVNQSSTIDGQQVINHIQDGTRMSKSNESNKERESKLYKRRWYVLMVFSLVAGIQGGYWNTWGPIADSSEEAFGWTDADIALLDNWGPIAYIISAVFFSWIVDEKGLRVATLTAAFFIAAGACVRCITDEPPYVTWTVHVGQLFNGLGGPVGMAVPPVLSCTWFPSNERTTATALGIVLGDLGSVISFLIGPYMVSEKLSSNGTNTSSISSLVNCTSDSCHSNNTDKNTRIQKERNKIMKLLYIEAAFAVLVFIMVLLYFPAKPKLPPSITASMERYNFKTGFKKLIGFADVFTKNMKIFLLALNITAAGFMIWFTILVSGFIPNSVVSLYVSIILSSLFLNATPALYFESACEVTYPVAEGVTTFVLTLMNNIGGLIFLLVQMIPNIGTAWENWCLVGAIVFCIPVLLMMKERYSRLDIDQSHNNKNR